MRENTSSYLITLLRLEIGFRIGFGVVRRICTRQEREGDLNVWEHLNKNSLKVHQNQEHHMSSQIKNVGTLVHNGSLKTHVSKHGDAQLQSRAGPPFACG